MLFDIKTLAFKAVWRLILVITASYLAVACGEQEQTTLTETQAQTTTTESIEESTNQTDKTLIWARHGDVDSLDPHRTTTTLSWQVFDQIYDTLLAFDANGKLVPHLAKSWMPSEDGREVTFVLNEGITCHDGTPFDGQDVKFTADRAFNTGNASVTQASWGPITSVEVIDPLTVKFKFSKPFGAFIPFMADPFAGMICDSVSELGSAFGMSTAIGTGPWKLVSWNRGDQIVLERNADYKNYGRPVANSGAPYLGQLIIKQVPEANVRLATLQAQEIEVITEPSLDDIEAIKTNDDLELVVADKTGQNVFLQFTVSRPPFNDVRARQAIAYAIDPQSALDAAFDGLVKREHCTVARGVLGNDQEFCKGLGYDHNPERAKQLLAELGYGPNQPLEITMLTWSGGNQESLLRLFQKQLTQVGIKAEIEIMDLGAMNARIRQENENSSGKGMFNLVGWGWYDPDILYALWHSPGAYSGFQTPELDKLLEKTRTVVAPAQRLEAVQAVQKYLLKNAVMIPIYTPGWLSTYTIRADVEGFKIGPFNRPIFNDVKINDVKLGS
ncbi:MAG: ABC transporter substrate-binding protein [Cyanothece sp. SIO1E1]|nr:ABC transporter substrate-binding protein [Cyanothece sp. SIO1E1]